LHPGNMIHILQIPEETRLQMNGDSGIRPLDDGTGLAEGCRRGDIAAYERLYCVQGARMKSLAFNMLGNRSDAEDAVQEAFLKIHRKADQFKGESEFATWVYRVLINACRDLMRRRRKHAIVSELPSPDAVAALNPEESRNHALRLTLESSLRKLSERERTVFLLFEVEGFRHCEIAGILEIPEGTSRHLLFEARKALQKSLSRSPGNRSGHEL
jgi:RNA polymerase sigma-70 factor (ECF subfamily)